MPAAATAVPDDHLVAPPHDEGKRLWRGIASLVLLVVLVGALLLAVPGLGEVREKLRDVAPGWIVLAVVLELLSCLGYVLAFQHVFWRVPRRFAARVALSEMAFGAVLPAGGAGGIAIGAYIVKAKGGPLGRFVQRSAVLFLLTSGVNAATLGVAGILVAVGIFDAPGSPLYGLIPGIAGLGGVALFALLPAFAARFPLGEEPGRIRRWMHATAGVVSDALHEIRHPTWRLAGALMYLWFDIAMLWVAFRAFGESMPVGAITLAFLIGYLGNVVPIPGGIGALDGGLAAALVLYGASATTAAVAVLVYHALVLWIPTLLGTIAFLLVRRTLDEPIVLRDAPDA